LDDMEGVQHRGGVGQLVGDRDLVADGGIQRGDLHARAERLAAFADPVRVGLLRPPGHEVRQPGTDLALAVARTHLRRLIRSRASPSGASGPPVVDPLPPSHPTITAHHGALAYLLGSTRYAPPRQPPNASKTAPIASDATECCTWSARARDRRHAHCGPGHSSAGSLPR